MLKLAYRIGRPRWCNGKHVIYGVFRNDISQLPDHTSMFLGCGLPQHYGCKPLLNLFKDTSRQR